MQAIVVHQLGVERDGQHVALPSGNGMSVDACQDLDLGAVLDDPWRPDEHRAQRPLRKPVELAVGAELEVGLEAVDLAAERIALDGDVHHTEVLAVEHDHARARAEHRQAQESDAEALRDLDLQPTSDDFEGLLRAFERAETRGVLRGTGEVTLEPVATHGVHLHISKYE